MATAAALAVIYWVPNAPYAVVGLAAACIAAIAARRSPPSSRRRFLLVQVAALALVFSVLEAYVWLGGRNPDFRVEKTRSAAVPAHPDLGYIFPPNGSITYRGYYRNELVFEGTTHFDEHGFVPPYPSKSRNCAMVFGGSFTAGYGVDDTEAMPYRLGELAGDSLRVYNFGLGGYGPHQMLSALQNGIVSEVVDCDAVKWVFYQGIPNHVLRAAGRSAWDRRGPRYVLDADGRAVRHGRFCDPLALEALTQLLNRSNVYRRLFGWDSGVRGRDIDLFMGILRETRRLVAEQYPGARFQIVFWDRPDDSTPTLLEAMKADGFVVHRVSDILDGFAEDPKPYLLPHEIHPNTRADDLVARYLFEHVIEAGTPSASGGGGQ